MLISILLAHPLPKGDICLALEAYAASTSLRQQGERVLAPASAGRVTPVP